MAGVTRHVLLTVREFGVDFVRHGQHHSGGFLLGLVVAREVTLHVAVSALYAQTGIDPAHYLNHLRSAHAR